MDGTDVPSVILSGLSGYGALASGGFVSVIVVVALRLVIAARRMSAEADKRADVLQDELDARRSAWRKLDDERDVHVRTLERRNAELERALDRYRPAPPDGPA